MKNSRSKNLFIILTVAVALCAAMILTTGPVNALAHKDGGCLGEVPSTSKTIAVDGIKESAYDEGLRIGISYPKSAEQSVGATGIVTLLCADGYLYVFFEVTDDGILYDPNPDFQKSSPWKTESCEVFINEKNSGSETDVVQYRIDCTGWPCVYTKTGTANYGQSKVGSAFGYTAALTPTGYKAEFRIPLKTVGKNVSSGETYELGVHFQINDVKDDEGNLNWATEYSAKTDSGADSWEVDAYPYVILGAAGAGPEVTEEPTAEPTEAPTEAPTDEPSATPETTSGEETSEIPTDDPETGEPETAEPGTAEPGSDEPETVEPAATDAPEATGEAAPEQTSEPEPDKKKGCGSVVGGPAAVLLVAAAAFTALKKSRKK